MIFKSNKKKKVRKDPELHKIEKALKYAGIEFTPFKIFKIGESIYENEVVFNKVNSAIINKDLDYLVKLKNIDVTKDMIQIFLIVDKKGKSILIGIIDPYELYDNPTVFAKSFDISFEEKDLEKMRIK